MYLTLSALCRARVSCEELPGPSKPAVEEHVELEPGNRKVPAPLEKGVSFTELYDCLMSQINH